MLGHSNCLQKPHYTHIGLSVTAPAAAPAATEERATNLFNYWKRIKALIFLIAETYIFFPPAGWEEDALCLPVLLHE